MTIIIGIGTGRCGTMSLTHVLNEQLRTKEEIKAAFFNSTERGLDFFKKICQPL